MLCCGSAANCWFRLRDRDFGVLPVLPKALQELFVTNAMEICECSCQVGPTPAYYVKSIVQHSGRHEYIHSLPFKSATATTRLAEYFERFRVKAGVLSAIVNTTHCAACIKGCRRVSSKTTLASGPVPKCALNSVANRIVVRRMPRYLLFMHVKWPTASDLLLGCSDVLNLHGMISFRSWVVT